MPKNAQEKKPFGDLYIVGSVYKMDLTETVYVDMD
jgi:hypothetical protein